MEKGWLKNLLKKVKLNESTISTVLGVLVILVIGVLIFNYFRGISQPEEETSLTSPEEIKLVEEEGKLYPEGLPTNHEVTKGEHLWSIAEKYYGSGYNWIDIAKENKLANPNLLAEGQKLVIPKAVVIKPLAELSAWGEPIQENTYTVAKGDHLWGIAVRAYGDGYKWVEIARENDLSDPGLIHPGNVLTLPR